MNNLLKGIAEGGDPEAKLAVMINFTAKQFPFLDSSSPVALAALCLLMVRNYSRFRLSTKATPIVASWEFLQAAALELTRESGTEHPKFFERDFVFAIKMFGLRIRISNGILQFPVQDEILPEDEEFVLVDKDSADEAAFYLANVRTRRKTEVHAIQSAANKLKRVWREWKLARVFADKISVEGLSIGAAKEYLRTTADIKEHEFVRIRKIAVEEGWFVSKRGSRTNRRVTLDEDVERFVAAMVKNRAWSGGKALTLSAATNKALRDFKAMIDPGHAASGGRT